MVTNLEMKLKVSFVSFFVCGSHTLHNVLGSYSGYKYISLVRVQLHKQRLFFEYILQKCVITFGS